MTRTLTLFLLAALVLTLTAFARPETRVVQDDDTQLELYMKDINRGLRALRKQLSDPEMKDATIQSIREIEILTIKARNEKPAKLEEIPEAAQAEFLMGYQKSMVEFTSKLMELEMAVVAGDMEKAEKLREAIGDLKKPAHTEYKK